MIGVAFDGVFLADGPPIFLTAGLFSLSVWVPFLKLVERRAVALSLALIFSDADMVVVLAGSWRLEDREEAFVGSFAMEDDFAAAMDTLVTLDLVIVLAADLAWALVADILEALAVAFVTVTFFFTCTGALLVPREAFALVTALLMVFLTDLVAITLRFLFSADVESSRILPSLRLVPDEVALLPFLAGLFLSSDFVGRSLGLGPRTPRHVGAPQRHSCTFFWEKGLYWVSLLSRHYGGSTHSKL